jgi:protein-S-isoprenylcysteine O-methyltransferase Ste14
MSLIPAFEIGVWNAWILQVIFIIASITPELLMDKEAKLSMQRMRQDVPLSRYEKILANSTHMVIMPLVLIYSIFLPLKTGTVWLYAGLFIFAVSLVMYIITVIGIANTKADKPVTHGIYRITRHPIYFSGFLLYLGTGIACASWIVILLALLWLIFFIIVVPAEERFLVEQYGETYREYLNKTPRWIGIPK